MKKFISLLLSAILTVSLITVVPITAGAVVTDETVDIVIPEEVTDATTFAEYLIENYDQDSQQMRENTCFVLDWLMLTPDSVMIEIMRIFDEKVSENALTEDVARNIKNTITEYLYYSEQYILYYNGDEYCIYSDKGATCDAIVLQRLGKYLVFFPCTTEDLRGVYFIQYEDEMYSLEEAYEMGIADEDDLALILSDADLVKFLSIGDANQDNLLDINDATQIQSYLAGITYFGYRQEQISDYNDDGVVDVNDVTAIQIKLAE